MKKAYSGAHKNKSRILVTAGPTRERIDPVRFISNYSTGVFGYEIAREAHRRGVETVLVSGPTSLKAPAGVKVIQLESAEEMYKAVLKEFKKSDYVVMAAAVSDWRVSSVSDKKIKKGGRIRSITLVENPDILAELGKRKGSRVIAGFALETEHLSKNAYNKLKSKNLDLIIANKTKKNKTAFGNAKTNIVIIDKHGGKRFIYNKSKKEHAKIILDNIFNFNI